ncbi:hypothetical protein C2E20_3298 [Micractinium conductrix]|uniref:BZIP domain-containing protein n=1 Tax=Micractinium conductrix TaxID=554055 RepID=A0A2P6VGS4_9CHLO|nr:hypothetical protein C2E20_3298 [Micractinium conductrix]|eukprot:PSC73277.1 hypothetical protein C2E20_3298 [Micractinium conductrix]
MDAWRPGSRRAEYLEERHGAPSKGTAPDDVGKWCWNPRNASGTVVPAFHCAVRAAPAPQRHPAYRPAGVGPAPHAASASLRFPAQPAVTSRSLPSLHVGGSGELSGSVVLSVAGGDQLLLEASTSGALLPLGSSSTEQLASSISALAALPCHPPLATSGSSVHRPALASHAPSLRPEQVAAPAQAPPPMPPQAVYGAAAAAAAVAAAGVQGGAAAEGTQPTLADDIAWLRGLFSDDSDKDERLVLPQRQLQAAQPGLPPPVPPPLHSADSLFAQLAGQQGSRAAAPPAAAAPTLSEPSSLQAQLQSAVAQLWQEQQVQQQAAALSMAQQAGPPVPVAPLSLSAAGSEASVLLALCQPVTTAPPPHMPPGPQPAGWARGRTTVAAAPAATCAAPAGIAAAAPAVPHASKPAKRRRGERYSDAELAVLAREDPPRYRRILSTRKSVAAHRTRVREARAAAATAAPELGQESGSATLAERLRQLEEENRRMREQLLRQRRGAAPAAGP